MKKQVKKLVLAKETLRNLEKWELVRVAGEASANTGCAVAGCLTYSDANTCGTCACGPTQTGTSRYC